MKTVSAIGMMSGTSLDGADIAMCVFPCDDRQPDHKILAAETILYNLKWKQKLSGAHHLNGEQLAALDAEYGKYLGKLVSEFIEKHGFDPDFIASHGHTVFHRPDRGFTLQIGSGAALAAETGRQVVSDFRSLDVALGGQGAPLVPIGDRMLFGEFAFCLNLGGFANVSFEQNGRRIAFDICPANIALNHYSARLGLEYDKDGKTAASGTMIEALLLRLNDLEYYRIDAPKSLGREWLETDFLPEIEKFQAPIPDILHTLVEHIAIQSTMAFGKKNTGKIMVTGGGAMNSYLISRIKSHAENEIVVPDEKLVNYKEALVFALLGMLRLQGRNNCLGSVTGARRDNCGGSVYFG